MLAAAGLLVASATSCFWLISNEFTFPGTAARTQVTLQAPHLDAAAGTVVAGSGKADSLVAATRRGDPSRPADAGSAAAGTNPGGLVAPAETDTPAATVARLWTAIQPNAGSGKDEPGPVRIIGDKAPVRVAALPGLDLSPATRSRSVPEPVAPRLLRGGSEPRTTLVAFDSAPFPYDGTIPGSGRRFLDTGTAGHRGHTNFRGRVFWEAETFSDSRVLLHIPPRFDANRPGVMVVFFHGHGANLERDVRDRQQVPAQISASGINAVLVAPQFAVNAADSSAGKFWEPGGFKRFVDEAAVRLARLYGDPRATQAFAEMPIVIVAYSGGFGPTLAVLDRGGVNARLRGLILLDALYSGTGKFASWIARNRSAFFVSSYTPHTRRLNAELEQLLRDRSVAYGGELKRHLPGSVTFLPTGDISHRDFVNRAWADSPLKDLLVRLDDFDLKGRLAATASASPPETTATTPPSDD